MNMESKARSKDKDNRDEWGLRRLFRPSLESLSVSESLDYYHQRNLVPSHLFRLGANLFGKNQGVRKRIIFAPTPEPRPDPRPATHGGFTQKADDNLESKRTQETQNLFALRPSTQQVSSSASHPPSKSDSDNGGSYREWLAERKALRHNLQHFGDCEKWLKTKERTEIEGSVLEQFKIKKRVAALTEIPCTRIQTESPSADEAKLTQAERNRLLRLEKRQLMKDLNKLEHFVNLSRPRLAGFYVYFEQRCIYNIPRDIISAVFERVRAPVKESVIEILCDALATRHGTIDYRLIFQGGYTEAVEQYMKDNKGELGESSSDMTGSATQDTTAEGIESSINEDIDQFCTSTMSGITGEWSRKLKEESHKQFEKLLEFCLKQNITLNRSLVERGLLLPPDKTRKQCLSQLRQVGADAPSRSIVQPRISSTKHDKEGTLHDIYGWQYKELRGTRGPRRTKLSTGVALIKPKTDCWLTYNEFQEITEEIQNQPDFNYKYHGLPPNNAFWPGALLDKLRLHLPVETLETKPYSLYNIFQPVNSSKTHNPFIPQHTDRRTKGVAWPVNSAGHVQLGPSLASTRKTFIL